VTELLKFNPIPRKFTFLLLFFVIILSAVLRLVDISNVPPGLYQDESAIGYNAYSILQTGKDEYGYSYPLYFKSFNDYKLPVYIYLTAASEKIFGVNEFAVRFTSILAGIFAVIIIFFFVKYLTNNLTLAFLTSLVLAINPTHLFFSRAAFEVNLALTLALAGTYFFVVGVTKKKFWPIILSVLFFCLCLYSYNVTRLTAPILLLELIILYRKEVRSFALRFQIGAVILFAILVAPFLLGFFSSSGVVSAKSALITSTDILALDLQFRSYLLSLPHAYISLFYNQYIYMVFQYLENLGTIISGAFFFVTGTTEQNQGIGNVGFFYLYDLPFFIWGLIAYFRYKVTSFKIFYFWLITVVLILALSKQVPQATRGYFLVLPCVCFIALGLFSFFRFLSTNKNKLVKYAAFIVFIAIAFYNIQYYFLSYYYVFPKESADAWRTEDRALALYLKENEKKYNRIIIDRSADFVYTTYLFYDQYPPQEFLKTAKRFKDGDLIKANAWGKYQIAQVNWKKDLDMPNTLIIATPADTYKHTIVLKKFYDPTVYTVLSINSTIVDAPQNDVKYVLVETDKNRDNVELLQQLGKEPAPSTQISAFK
jgi:4-amino-4-deoxy-L-arabinose transferase-like glycosyltransferase